MANEKATTAKSGARDPPVCQLGRFPGEQNTEITKIDRARVNTRASKSVVYRHFGEENEEPPALPAVPGHVNRLATSAGRDAVQKRHPWQLSTAGPLCRQKYKYFFSFSCPYSSMNNQ